MSDKRKREAVLMVIFVQKQQDGTGLPRKKIQEGYYGRL